MILATFTVPGQPEGKGRPRCSVIGGKPRMRTPTKTRQYEARIATAAAFAWAGRPPLDVPVSVEVRAVKSRPKSRPKSVPLDAWKTNQRAWRGAKPDADNVAKAVLDALTMAGVLLDDVWAVRVVALSLYAAKGEAARTEVRIVRAAAVPSPLVAP